MASFDGVVIGAGHNGLALASYLSRAGLKLAVLERNPRIGGGCSTDEPTLPGYRFNLHSNFFMGFRHSPLIRDLDLHRFGFAYIEPPVQQGAAFRDGTCVVIHKDLERPAPRWRASPSATPRRSARCTTSTASRCARCSPRSRSTPRCRSTR